MTFNNIPQELQSFVAKYPQYEPIIKAMCKYDAGHAVTTCCSKCGHVLVVTDMPLSRWVTCANRCTSYRLSYGANRNPIHTYF
jgi:hypothetical protein